MCMFVYINVNMLYRWRGSPHKHLLPQVIGQEAAISVQGNVSLLCKSVICVINETWLWMYCRFQLQLLNLTMLYCIHIQPWSTVKLPSLWIIKPYMKSAEEISTLTGQHTRTSIGSLDRLYRGMRDFSLNFLCWHNFHILWKVPNFFYL